MTLRGGCGVGVVLLLVVIVLTIPTWWAKAPSGSGGPSARPGVPPEGRAAYTKVTASEVMGLVVPLVERYGGRKFEHRPRIQLVNRHEIERVLLASAGNSGGRSGSGASAERGSADGQLTAHIRCEAAGNLAEYVPPKHTLYLLPKNLEPIASLLHADRNHFRGILTLVMAHELAHCLQDQCVGMPATRMPSGGEGQEAALARAFACEGFATYVEELVARRLGLQWEMKWLRRLVSTDISATLQVAGSTPQVDALHRDMYLKGRDFILWQAKHGGMRRVWRALANPPDQISSVYHPERYDPSLRHDTSYAGVLDGIETRFATREWRVRNHALDRAALKSAYAAASFPGKEKVLEGVIHFQSLTAISGDVIVWVWVATLKAPRLARGMISLEFETLKGRLGALRAAGARISEPSLEPFRACTGDFALRTSFVTDTGRGLSTTSHVFVGRGKTVVAVASNNIALPDDKMAAICDEVFRKAGRAEARAQATAMCAPR